MTAVPDERPPELTALLERRRKLGLDTFDEVWEGEYHLASAADVSHGWLDDELAGR